MLSLRIVVAAVSALTAMSAGRTEETNQPSIESSLSKSELTFFENRIRPVLFQHCYECHSESTGTSESGLLVDTREGLRQGGDRGPAVVEGKPDASLLLVAMSHGDSDLLMPPHKDRLPDEVIDDFRQWIKQGAKDPRDQVSEPDSYTISEEDFWAYQPVQLPEVPHSDSDWPRSPIDHFILRKLDQHDLRPTADAAPETLLRRLFFDLLGLPPSPSDLRAFSRRVSTQGLDSALEDEVDRLLQSSSFGERWGRHWLDVARYGESSGKEANITFPYAWRYRDYVIDALNADLPYNLFLKEQIAGDLLPFDDDEERTRLLVATGFLAIGPKNLDATDPRQFVADVIDEQIDAVTRVYMGSSVACARCHDHKFDPFTMEDYYALAGIFSSTSTFFGTSVSPSNRVGGDPLPLPRLESTPILHRSIKPDRVQSLKAEKEALQNERAEKGATFTLRDALRVFWRTGAIDGQLEKVDEHGQALPLAMGVLDGDEIKDAPLLLRGEVNRPDAVIPRAFPAAIPVSEPPAIGMDQSGRLAMAEWLTRPDHPLTARVAVNRVWSHLFGAGIVETVDDFGSTGRTPSHPELLDHLAIRFVGEGWSLKQLVREIVLSRAYRQSSRYDSVAFQVDPENRLMWRMSKRRLEAEAMRDAMLSVSGELDITRPTGSLVGKVIGDRPVSLVGLDKRLPRDLDGAVHRSVYLPILRDRLPDVLEVFDFAEPSLVTGQRDSTNVPTQALYLMNSDFVYQRAVAMAKRLHQDTTNDVEFIQQAYRRCYGRDPSDAEASRVETFLAGHSTESSPISDVSKFDRAVSCCQALMSTVEFRVLD